VTSNTATLERSSSELLGDAVHQHGRLSLQGSLERAFTFAFRSMVYAQIWEDPDVDMAALEITPQSRIVTIASGGCNIMSYLTANPAQIYAVDLNATHVALVKLKLAAAQHIQDHTAFFQFFGSANTNANVALYDTVLAANLDEDTRAYWEGREISGRRRINRFARNLYKFGLLGRFITAGHLMARALGTNPAVMMTANSREEQIALFEKHLAPLFRLRILKWLTSHRASLFGLGIPPAQYDALCDHGALEMSDVLHERVRRLATDFDLKDNYFAWQAFGRGYAQDGTGPLPPYLQKENFAAVKIRAPRAIVMKESLITFLEQQPSESLDRYVLLDAQDWMDDDTLNALWREITRTARPGSRVIFRTAGRETILPGRVLATTLGQWQYHFQRSAALHAQDRSAIYGGFHLYTKAA
jgi:S-adenosylmethionine-diacylglycerol 3-amino-3-carboxypropyl transferase